MLDNEKWGMSRRAALALAGAMGVMFMAGAVDASDVKVSKTAFRYNGVNYFRAKSENIRLVSYGDKKTPVGQANYLAVQNNITGENLAKVGTSVSGPFTIDWSKVSKVDAEGGGSLKYFMKGGGKASFSHSKAESAHLKLVKFSINEGPLKTLLNNHATGARNFLKGEGNSGRVVSEVWVVMEAELASEVTTSGSVSGNASAQGIEVKFKAGGSRTATSKIVIAPDTTFAYLLHKVKRWDGNQVKDLEDDQHGSF